MTSIKPKEEVLFIYPMISSFIKKDIEILSSHYKVICDTHKWRNKLLTPFNILSQMILVFKKRKHISKIIISFGGYWSLAPSLLGKMFKIPVFIILNGTDCSSLPSFNYGSFRKPILRFACKISYKFATQLFPVSHSLVKTENFFHQNEEEKNQGFLHFFPELKTPYKVIHNGVDCDFWKKKSSVLKDGKSFIAVFSQDQFYLKGGDVILETSKLFSDCNFHIVGSEKPQFIEEEYRNVVFHGKISPEKLLELFSKSQFHFQLSVFEGFGMSICEAMLCECIPIGSNVNILPEIINEYGLVVDKKGVLELEECMNKALSIENKMRNGKQARNHIKKNYSFEKRKFELLFALK